MSEQEVLHALEVLYAPTANTQLREQAHSWLLAWKEKADLNSWNVCFSIFKNPAHSSAIHHFTALCLYHFIQSNVQWRLLNPDSYGNLAAALFASLTRKDLNYESVVKKRLCVMLAGLAVRSYPTHWPTFFLDMFYLLNSADLYEKYFVNEPACQSNGVSQEEKEQFLIQQQASVLPPSLIKSLALSPLDPATTPFALEILRALPEELQLYIIPKTIKTALEKKCKYMAKAVLYTLTRLLNQHPNWTESILGCAQTWIQHIEIHISDVVESGFLQINLQGLMNEEYTQAFTNTFLEVLRSAKNLSKFPTISLECIRQVSNLKNVYQSLLDSDDDRVTSICRVVASMIEDYPEMIISHFQSGGGAIVELALLCTSHPEKEMCQIMLELWYSLQCSLCENSELSKSSPVYQAISQVFIQLIHILLRQCMYEGVPDWDQDEEQEFAEFRNSITDTFQYCYNVLGENLLPLLLTILQDLLKGNPNWQMLEAVLFALSSLGECVLEEDHIGAVFEGVFFVEKNTQNLILTNTALCTIREYAERLSKKKFSNYLSESLNLITQAIHKESLQASATKTLSTICRNCDELLGEFYPTLYGIFSPFLLNTNFAEKNLILDSLARVCGQLPADRALPAVFDLIKPIQISIQKLFGAPPNTKDLELLFKNEIDLLYTICVSWKAERARNEPAHWDKILRGELPPSQHPLIYPLSSIWEIVQQVHAKFSTSFEISSSISSLIKSAALAAHDDFTPLLPSSLNMLTTSLKNSQNEIVLKIVPVIFSNYSDPTALAANPQTAQQLLEFFDAISVCVSQFGNTGNQFWSQNPHLLKEYFIMLGKIYDNTNSKVIVRSKVFFQVVGFAVQLLPTTGNVSVFKSITSFLTKLFQVTPLGMEQFTDELTNQVGPVVFSQLFQGMEKNMARGNIISLAYTCFDITQLWRHKVTKWLQDLLTAPNFPFPNVADSVKKQFIEKAITSHTRADFSNAVAEFWYACKGWQGSSSVNAIVIE